MIRVDDRVWILWALWILVLPLKWLVAAAAAACVHELFHIAAVLLLKGDIRYIMVRPHGIVIEAEGISGLRESVCALAGPLGSLLLVLLIHRFPMIGLCALVQGAFNLLPVYPMDGGRALLRLLEGICPKYAERLGKLVEVCVLTALLAASVAGAVRFSLGCMPILVCSTAILYALLRKRP